jgi:hypothetical protein
MHVHIDEAGCDDQPGGVELLGSGDMQLLADSGDPAIFHQYVADRIQPAGGIEHAAISND